MSTNQFEIGNRCETEKGKGTIAFYGETEFADGLWVGIELDESIGKNNGTVQGRAYFVCADNHGIFLRPNQVKVEGQQQQKSRLVAPTGSSGIRPPNTSSSVRKDNVTTKSSKQSPGASPHMSPSPSMEKLKAPSKKSAKEESPEQRQTTSRIVAPSVSGTPEAASTPSTRHSSSSTSSDAVRERVKKLEEVPMPMPRAVPDEMSEAGELEFLRIERRDMMEKLETLRQRRAEDKVKLIDYERCRIQLQQLLEFKSKMTEAHSDIQRQLQESRKEAKEAIEARQKHQEEMSGFAEQVEMATLDREMAEEKVELLQQEVESLKDKCTELEADLEILRAEMAEPNSVQGNSVQMKQVEQQNERLREALVKIRDLSAQTSSDGQRFAKENEELRAQVAEMVKKCDKMQHELVAAEALVNEFKEQVDASLGAEQMVEKLATDSLMLEERNRELQEAIEDLEAMRTMDEEMLESQRDVERDLRIELEGSAAKMNELLGQLKSCAAQADDYEKTIIKFRQKTSDLHEEIQDLRDQVLRAEAKARGDMDGVERTSFSLFSADKNFADYVENEIRIIDLTYSRQHAKYLKAFLPDNFGKPGGDNDAVILSMLFPRLSSKAMVLSRLLNDKNPPVPGGMRREHVTKSHKAEQWGHCAKFSYYLNALTTIVRKFETALSRCSVERLARLAHLQLEMAAQERMIDNYIELLKTNRLDENTSFDNIERVINYFQNIFSVHMVGDAYDTNQYLQDTIEQLLSGLRWFRINIDRIGYFFLPGNEECEFSRHFKSLLVYINESEQFCVRIKNHIPGDKDLDFSTESLEWLSEAVGSLEKSSNVVHHTCAIASTQVSMLPDVEGLEMKRMEEMLFVGAEKVHGKLSNGKQAEEQLTISLGTLLSKLSKLSETMEKGTLLVDRPETKPFPPLLDRAHARKQDAVEAEGLRWQLEKKENEILELKKVLRIKAEEISESKVRLEMAEKRAQSTGKEGDEHKIRLQRKVDDLMADALKKETQYEKTMDTLQQELVASEKENSDLKEKIKLHSKRALLGMITRDASSPNTPMSPGFSGPPTVFSDSPLLQQEIQSLKEALSYSESERVRLLGNDLLQTVKSLSPLTVPHKPAGPTGLVDFDLMSNTKHDELCQLMKESDKFTEAYIGYIRNLRLPDLSKKDATTPQLQMAKLMSENRRITNWRNDLHTRTMKYRSSQLYGSSASTDFAQFPTPSFCRQSASAIDNNSSSIFARMRMRPIDSNDAGKTYRIMIDDEQFGRIHQQLVT